MATMSRSNALAYGLLLALAFALNSRAAHAESAFFYDPYDSYVSDYYDDQRPFPVNSTQVFIALCTGDGSYQPYHQQADYCSAISSGSFPKTQDLIDAKGFFLTNGWSAYFNPVVGPTASRSEAQPSFSFQMPAGLPAPELLAAVISGYSKYTVVVAEAFVTPDYELRPVSLWVFRDTQVLSLNYNGGSYGYADAFQVAYYKLSYTAFRTDSRGSSKALKPFCYDYEKNEQC